MHLIRFFKSGFPAQFMTIGIIGILIWGSAAIHPPEMPQAEGPDYLYRLLYELINKWPYLAFMTGFCLILFEAVWVNHLLAKHDLIPNNTSLASLLFLLFASLFPAGLTLTPHGITLLFILLILQQVFQSYNQPDSTIKFFIAGFYTALASFFFVPAIFLFVFLLISILIFRGTRYTEWFSCIVGVATPFFFLFSFLFLTDSMAGFWHEYPRYFQNINVSLNMLSPWDSALLLIPAFLLIAGVRELFARRGEKTVVQRKKSIVLLWLLVWAECVALCSGTHALIQCGLSAIGLSFLATNFFFRPRKPFLLDLLLWIFLASIFLNTLRVTWLG